MQATKTCVSVDKKKCGDHATTTSTHESKETAEVKRERGSERGRDRDRARRNLLCNGGAWLWAGVQACNTTTHQCKVLVRGALSQRSK